MSEKAIWNNRRKHNWCSNTVNGDLICCGGSRDGTMPQGMVKYGTFRVIAGRHLLTPEYGTVMTEKEADDLDQLHGRSVPFTRNVVSFVCSRAARKRGVKPTDPLFLARQQHMLRNRPK